MLLVLLLYIESLDMPYFNIPGFLFYFIFFNYCNKNNNLHNLTGKEKLLKTSHDISEGYISRRKRLPRNSYFGSVEKRFARYSVCWQYKLNKLTIILQIMRENFIFTQGYLDQF